MNAFGGQWRGYIFILRYKSLKMAFLLHKTALTSPKLWSWTVRNNTRLCFDGLHTLVSRDHRKPNFEQNILICDTLSKSDAKTNDISLESPNIALRINKENGRSIIIMHGGNQKW